MLFKSVLVFTILHLILSHRNNVCNCFVGYFYPDFCSACYYDDIAALNSSEIISKYVPEGEVHEVVSEDGYITTMFRIPRNHSKGVILLHHSIATDSRLYLWQGNESFAFQLWKQGYDVWLTNHRGTAYSLGHTTIKSSDYHYWNFSFHEIARDDVSAELRFINKIVNEKIIYIGHSLGATIGLIYSSIHAEEAASYVKNFIFISVPFTFKATTSPIMWFSAFATYIRILVETLRIGQTVLFLKLIWRYSHYVLRMLPFILPFSNLIVCAFVGWTPQEMDRRFFNFDGGLNFDNCPFKMFVHFLQLAQKEEFRMYDYGQERNSIIYGNVIPPLYPVEQIQVPILLISSMNDSLVTVQNVESLYESLPKIRNGSHEHWVLSGLNHIDYFVGQDRNQKFTNRLLDYLRTI